MSWPRPQHGTGPNGVRFVGRDGGLAIYIDARVSLIAMGCVKPANDDEEFYRQKRKRDGRIDMYKLFMDSGMSDDTFWSRIASGYPLPLTPPQ